MTVVLESMHEDVTSQFGPTIQTLSLAVGLILLIACVNVAGLILRSFAKLVSVDRGFEAANVLTAEVEPLDRAAPVRRDYYNALAGALRQVPEVVAAGAIDRLSLTGGGSYGFPKTDKGVGVQGPQRTILPGYHRP